MTLRRSHAERARLALIAAAALVLGGAVVARSIGEGAGLPGASGVGSAAAAVPEPAAAEAAEPAPPTLDEQALRAARERAGWIAERRPFTVVSFDPPPAARERRVTRRSSEPREAGPPPVPTVTLRFTGLTRGPAGPSAVFEDRGRGTFLLVRDGEPLGERIVRVLGEGRLRLEKVVGDAEGAEGAEGGEGEAADAEEVAVGDRVTVVARGNLDGWQSGSRPASSGSEADRSGSSGSTSSSEGKADAAPSPAPSSEQVQSRLEELRARRRAALEGRQGE